MRFKLNISDDAPRRCLACAVGFIPMSVIIVASQLCQSTACMERHFDMEVAR